MELKLSEVLADNISFRFDSEYSKKDYLSNINVVLNYKNGYVEFDQIIKRITGGATPLGANYLDSGTPFLRVQNIMQNYYNLNDIVYISKDSDKEIKRSRLKLDDVLLTITGVSYGKSAVVYKDLIGSNINQHSVKIEINNEFKPLFISTFLNSKIGKLQSDKNIVGISRPALDYASIKKFVIPKVNMDFQLKIEQLVKSAHQKLEQSKELYGEAENILLAELDLLDFKPSNDNIAIKSFSESFGDSGRLDSEYYQPKYDEIIAKIKNYRNGFEKLKYFSESYSTGYPFKSDSYIEKGTYLIRINNIKQGYLDISNATTIPSNDKNLSIKDIAKENDVLISMSGTIGNSCKIPKGTEAVINQRIMKITPQNIGIELLPLLINSVIGKTQLERIGTGGVQTNISSSDILNILIPIIDKQAQTKIEQKIQQSFQLKEQAKQLLELAKQSVEVAIEQDEQMAMELINEHIQNL